MLPDLALAAGRVERREPDCCRSLGLTFAEMAMHIKLLPSCIPEGI